LLINEVLADPSGYDINGDNWADPFEDEFIEILNVDAVPINLRGVSVRVGSRVPHRFSSMCILPGKAIALFGGRFQGKPSEGELTAQHSLKLPNSGGNIALLMEDEMVIDLLTYGPEADGPHSIARIPDGDETWGIHPYYQNSLPVIHSAGRCVNGGQFPTCSHKQGSTDATIGACKMVQPGEIVINEVLADPGHDDANGDGVPVWHQDEFVELLLTADGPRDLDGLQLMVNDQLRLRLGPTCLPSRTALVIFGGGKPTLSPRLGAIAITSDKSLRLPNFGASVTISSSGKVFDRMVYGAEADDETSLTRSPDGTGDFVLHTDVSTDKSFSPGACLNGFHFETGCSPPTGTGERIE